MNGSKQTKNSDFYFPFYQLNKALRMLLFNPHLFLCIMNYFINFFTHVTIGTMRGVHKKYIESLATCPEKFLRVNAGKCTSQFLMA